MSNQQKDYSPWIPIHESISFLSKEEKGFLVPLREVISIKSLASPNKCAILRIMFENSKVLFELITKRNIQLYFLSDTDTSRVPIKTIAPQNIDELNSIILEHLEGTFKSDAPDCPRVASGQIVIHVNDLLINDIGYHKSASLKLIMSQTGIQNPSNRLKYFLFAWEEATKSDFQKKLQITPRLKALKILDPEHYWKVCNFKEPTIKDNEPYEILSAFQK